MTKTGFESQGYRPTDEEMQDFIDYCDEQRRPCSCIIDNTFEDGGIAIEKVKLIPYAFTLRKTSKKQEITEALYEYRMQHFPTKIDLIDYTYEQDAGLHVHGIIDVPIKFNLTRLKRRGWNILVKPITDRQGWEQYMYKKQKIT